MVGALFSSSCGMRSKGRKCVTNYDNSPVIEASTVTDRVIDLRYKRTLHLCKNLSKRSGDSNRTWNLSPNLWSDQAD